MQTVDQFGGKSRNAAFNSVFVPVSKVVPASGLRAVNLQDGIELEWNTASDSSIGGFKIYRYQRGKEPVNISHTEVRTRNYLDKSAKKGELYFYYITN